jgi:hypothetical protein
MAVLLADVIETNHGALLEGKRRRRKPHADDGIATDCLLLLLDRAERLARDVVGHRLPQLIDDGLATWTWKACSKDSSQRLCRRLR